MAYDPKTLATGVVPTYVVKTTGDRFFIPAYPQVSTPGDDLAQCLLLSPHGVELVAA